MFRRRFYYDLTTGAMLRSYTAEGDINSKYTPEHEAEALGLENWGVLEWLEKDPETEAAFAPFDAEGNLRSVTAYIENGVLTFDYEAIPAEDDPYTIIDTLTGEVE